MNVDLRNIGCRIALNDHSALRELYDHFGDQLYQLALAIVHTPEMAEEIVEDVFIAVWKNRARMTEIESLPKYLYVSTRNISRSYLRKYRNRSFVDFDEVQLPYYRVNITPEDILISTEITQRINIAINELPPKCRLIFKLVKEDGLKYREVAELLHLTVKTVENQMAIAVKKIHSAVTVFLHA